MPGKLRELQRLWLIEAVRHDVLPLDDRRVERFDPGTAGRPQLATGTSQKFFRGMGRLTEASLLNIKNRSHSVTAELLVPETGAQGVIMAQGGAFGGWALDITDGQLRYCHNLLGLQRFKIARELFEIDPARGSLERTLPLDLQPGAAVVAGGAIWVAGYDDATVEKIDPASGRVTGRVHVGDGPAALVFGAGSLWVANSLDATVSRVDPVTLTVRATIPVGSAPSALAVGAGSVWVADQDSGSVSRIDPRRDRVVASAAVGGAPTSLTTGGGRLWAGVAAAVGGSRGGRGQPPRRDAGDRDAGDPHLG